MEYVCAENSPVQSSACTKNLQHKVKLSQVDAQLEKTLLCTKLRLLTLNSFNEQESSRLQLQQRDTCSPTLIMEVMEVEKESQDGEEKERAANMTAVSSLRCGKVNRQRKLRKVSLDLVLICLFSMLLGKRQRKNKKVPEVTVVFFGANDTEKSANSGECRKKSDRMTVPPKI